MLPRPRWQVKRQPSAPAADTIIPTWPSNEKWLDKCHLRRFQAWETKSRFLKIMLVFRVTSAVVKRSRWLFRTSLSPCHWEQRQAQSLHFRPWQSARYNQKRPVPSTLAIWSNRDDMVWTKTEWLESPLLNLYFLFLPTATTFIVENLFSDRAEWVRRRGRQFPLRGHYRSISTRQAHNECGPFRIHLELLREYNIWTWPQTALVVRPFNRNWIKKLPMKVQRIRTQIRPRDGN